MSKERVSRYFRKEELYQQHMKNVRSFLLKHHDENEPESECSKALESLHEVGRLIRDSAHDHEVAWVGYMRALEEKEKLKNELPQKP